MLKGSEKKRGRRRKVKASRSYLESLSLLNFGGEFFYFVSFCICMFFFVYLFAFCLMKNTAGMDGGSSFWKYLMAQANEAMQHRENGDSSAAPSVKSPSS